MRQQWLMGNWKMNGSCASIEALLTGLLQHMPLSLKASVVVFPPFVYLPLVRDRLQGSAIGWGAQATYPADRGAYTGAVSSEMLHEFGCQFVLVGHSERRRLFQESEALIAEQLQHVKSHGMRPVLCIGETLAERTEGLTESVLKQQLLSAVQYDVRALQEVIVAYEPVWAIGTGQAATPAQVQETHAFIRRVVAAENPQIAEAMSIVYGGSVTADNAKELFALSEVDGGLVGGASLEAAQFVRMMECINSY